MSNFSNKDITYWKSRLQKVKTRLRSNKGKQKRLQNQILKDERILNKFEYAFGKIINHDGVWLEVDEYESLNGIDCRIGPMADDNQRHADIYQNATNNILWGAHLRIFGGYSGSKEVWLGCKWRNYNEIVKAGKDWVATGKLPKGYFKKDMF